MSQEVGSGSESGEYQTGSAALEDIMTGSLDAGVTVPLRCDEDTSEEVREKVGNGDAIGFLNESQLALSFLGSGKYDFFFAKA